MVLMQSAIVLDALSENDDSVITTVMYRHL